MVELLAVARHPMWAVLVATAGSELLAFQSTKNEAYSALVFPHSTVPSAGTQPQPLCCLCAATWLYIPLSTL